VRRTAKIVWFIEAINKANERKAVPAVKKVRKNCGKPGGGVRRDEREGRGRILARRDRSAQLKRGPANNANQLCGSLRSLPALENPSSVSSHHKGTCRGFAACGAIDGEGSVDPMEARWHARQAA
jgi:hypothetical protein